MIDNSTKIPYTKSKENNFLHGGAMHTAKLTSKGQITIPMKVREKLGVSSGETLQFEENKGVFTIRKSIKKSPFDGWVGYLKKQKTNDTANDTDRIIEKLRGR